jgi:hypothetical protein
VSNERTDPHPSRMEFPMRAFPRTSTPFRIALAATSCALAATFAYSMPTASEEHVGVDAERGDPARWYQPADTPRLKYETRVKEARAALAEALKECRGEREGRRACVAEAKAQERRDMDDARDALREGRRGRPMR